MHWIAWLWRTSNWTIFMRLADTFVWHWEKIQGIGNYSITWPIFLDRYRNIKKQDIIIVNHSVHAQNALFPLLTQQDCFHFTIHFHIPIQQSKCSTFPYTSSFVTNTTFVLTPFSIWETKSLIKIIFKWSTPSIFCNSSFLPSNNMDFYANFSLVPYGMNHLFLIFSGFSISTSLSMVSQRLFKLWIIHVMVRLLTKFYTC